MSSICPVIPSNLLTNFVSETSKNNKLIFDKYDEIFKSLEKEIKLINEILKNTVNVSEFNNLIDDIKNSLELLMNQYNNTPRINNSFQTSIDELIKKIENIENRISLLEDNNNVDESAETLTKNVKKNIPVLSLKKIKK